MLAFVEEFAEDFVELFTPILQCYSFYRFSLKEYSAPIYLNPPASLFRCKFGRNYNLFYAPKFSLTDKNAKCGTYFVIFKNVMSPILCFCS